MSEKRSFSEEFRFAGAQAVEVAKELVHAGNVRHVEVRRAGRTLVDLPLTVVVVGALIAPALAVLGGLLAIFTESNVAVTRAGEPADKLEG